MIELTQDQTYILNEAVKWYKSSTSEQVFQISGPPGSGKTILIKAIMDALGLDLYKVMPMAYTGCASLVLRTRGFLNAKTIHSSIYDMIEAPMIDNYGNPVVDRYFNTPIMKHIFIPKPDINADLLIIDEGSFVPMSMKHDIEKYGKKIIVAGDLDQLPPVGDNPAYLYNGKVYRLNQIMRQAQNSAIVYLSQLAINNKPIHAGMYGRDVMVIRDIDVTDEMLGYSSILLCGKNTTREYLNTKMRNLLGHRSITPEYLERIIFRKNDWNTCIDNINITNGLIGTVMNSPDPLGSKRGIFSVNFLPDLSRVIFNNIDINYNYFTAPFELKKEIKNSKWTEGMLAEFAYAITTHLSQGSEYSNGMYFEEFLNPNINNKLNYTAITRFRNHLIYVKKTKDGVIYGK